MPSFMSGSYGEGRAAIAHGALAVASVAAMMGLLARALAASTGLLLDVLGR